MPIPPELASACADIAAAGGADAIGGRQARYVAAPASTQEASALLRAAAALGLTVVPRGAGRLLPQVSGGISLRCADPEHAQRLVEEVSAPWIAASGIDLHWPSADEPLRLIVMIHGDREHFEARSMRLHALDGRPAPPPIDRARPRRLDDPDHGGLPPAVAQELLAHRDRIRAELLDPPADTGDAGARFVSANAARGRADPDPDGGGGQRGRRRDRGIGRRGRP